MQLSGTGMEYSQFNDALACVWDDEKTKTKEFSDPIMELYREFAPVALCMVIARIALEFFHSNYFKVFLIASSAFLITSIVKKVFHDYNFLLECERMAIVIARRWPFLHVAGTIVGTLFFKEAPIVFIPMIASIGALTALTFRVKWLSAASDE